MKIVHSGFDQLDVAFMGKMRQRTMLPLLAAKEEAKAAERAVSIEINGVTVTVAPNGTRAASGYALIIDTGPTGFTLRVKRSSDETQWNLFVESRSFGLATRTFDQQIECMYDMLKALDCVVLQESVNRFDFAVDFAFDRAFQPDDRRFVHHAKCFSETHEDNGSEHDDDAAYSKVGLRTIRGITMGKNPCRQVQLYDKRHEQRSKQSTAWYEIWGFTKENCPHVWRVEMRSYKRDLDQWNVKTLDDLRAKAKSVMLGMLKAFRYVETRDLSNISRAKLDPLWLAVTECAEHVLSTISGQRTHVRKRVVECVREDAMRQNVAQISGLIARQTHLHGMSDGEVLEMAPQMASDITNHAIRQPQFRRCRERAGDTLVFIKEGSRPNQYRKAA